jgi:eukaryotic-like serine/threonine-protein kinase
MSLAVLLADALRDRYLIERELGRGGMATVYLARDLKHDRLVALKALHPELAVVLGPERFLREIKLAARLQHPHILTVHDSGESAGRLWYTMPYVQGETLRDRLRREHQLGLGEAIRLACEVAEALSHAHHQGTVHRDIKPENILLSDGHALVADFGIARALGHDAGEQLTGTGMSIGTPAYMSPEQSTGEREVDGRSDVYSLATVLYEMLAGEAPYSGSTAKAIITKRLVDPVPDVRRLRPNVPIEISDLLVRSLSSVPADRPDAASFARELSAAQHYSKQHPGKAGFHSSASPRRSWVVAALVVIALILVAGAGTHWFGQASTSGGRESPMLVVLPFKNLGAASDQYFADGLAEELTTRLAALHDLGVISRTSADRYRASTKSLKQIGSELGAQYALEGSVRWEKAGMGASRIRVTPQLIRTSDDRHLWANQYDAELADVFAVQSAIAEQVTSALGVALAPPERTTIGAQPTRNLSAYDAYLRGNAAMPPDFTIGFDRIISGLNRATEQYREAVRLDSTFALAWAKLGLAYTWISRFGPDPRVGTSEAQFANSRALALAPDLADAHLAEGIYQNLVTRDRSRGIAELERAIQGRPNDGSILITAADVEWYVSGRQRRSLELAQRAMELDPLSNSTASIAARIYRDAGRFDDAERIYDQIIARDPRNHGTYTMKALTYLLRDGDTLRARAIIREAATHVDTMALVTSVATTHSAWFALGMLEPSFQRILLQLPVAAFGGDTGFRAMVLGYTYRSRGDSVRYHAYYDTTEQYALAKLRTSPKSTLFLMLSVWPLAASGHREEAYSHLNQAWKGLNSNTFDSTAHAFLARLGVLAQDTATALSELEKSPWGPELSIPWLCTDPFFASLRSHVRFQRVTQGRCPAKRP